MSGRGAKPDPDEVVSRVTHTCGCVCEWRAIEPINAFVLHGLALSGKRCPWHGGESGERVSIETRGLLWEGLPFARALSVLLVTFKAQERISA